MAAPATAEECRAFLSGQGEVSAVTAELPAALGELLDAGLGAWPELAADRVGFAVHLGRRIPSDVDWIEALRGRAIDDLYLAHRCLAGDPAAIRHLELTYLHELRGLLVKRGFAAGLVDDTIQTLSLRMLTGNRPILRAYNGAGSLKAWLRITAIREAVRATRKQNAISAEEITDALADTTMDPALRYQRKLYQDEFRAAFELAIASLSVRDRNLLRQSVVYGATVDDLGAIYNVHRATAAKWVAQARQRLADETKRHMVDRLQIQPTEYESILTLINSQLHVSIERVLGES
jgi:RNA polymerase sigma-70 factor (ECF subfamily)